MSWTLNPAVVGTHIFASVFQESGWSSFTPPVGCIPFKGTMPLAPTITTGVTALQSGITSAGSLYWNAPTDGVATLSTPIIFTPNTSGTLSFIRFYAQNNTTFPLFDISCALSPSDNSATTNTLTIVSGTPFSLTDIRLKLNTTGDVSVSPSIANDFIRKMSSGSLGTYGAGLYAASNYDPWSGLYNRTVSIKLYSGTIPNRADNSPTGVELWTTNLSGSNTLFNQSGLSLALTNTLTANAIASGTPTYCRIRRAGYTSGGGTVYPTTIIQVPVTTDGSGCTLSASSFTSGQSYSITGLTLTLQ